MMKKIAKHQRTARDAEEEGKRCDYLDETRNDMRLSLKVNAASHLARARALGTNKIFAFHVVFSS